MYPAKRQKKTAEPKLKDNHLTAADQAADEGSEYAQLAKQHWIKSSKTAKVKVKKDVLKGQLWDPLERDKFPLSSLLELESLQILESYLWPGYGEASSNHHVLLIVMIVNAKRRERLETWSNFQERPDDFATLFRRILSMSLERSLPVAIRTHVLCFMIHAFQSLDCGIVRKECASLVSIPIWHNLSTEKKRDEKLAANSQFRRAWKAAAKRYDSGDEPAKAGLRFDRSWLYTLVLDFLSLLYVDTASADDILYCERFVEFLSDLESQLPTRRYTNFLLQDLHIIPAALLSPMFNDEENGLLRDLLALLSHYMHFGIDDQTGVQQSKTQAYNKHCANLAKLQRTALKHFKEKLKVLALSNYASIDDRRELENLLAPLTDDEVTELSALLDLRISFPKSTGLTIDRRFLLEAILSTFEKCKTFQEVSENMSVMPTEQTLFEQSLLRIDSYDGSHPLPIPKLNLQFLSAGDFLWRSLVLYRCESFYGIRRDIEDVLRRLKPANSKTGELTFSGFSKMALPVSRPSILEVMPPLVGDDKPSMVRAEISIDVRRVSDAIRREWEALRPDDVVFLLAVDAPRSKKPSQAAMNTTEAQKLGLRIVRCAEIIQVLDDKGRPIRDAAAYFDGHARSPTRRIQLKLDSRMYKADQQKVAAGKPDMYDSVNFVMRRSGRENNFKPVLESIKSLTLSEVPLVPWLHEVFLGYGDPAGPSYKHLPNRLTRIDYRDTFLDWQHLVESMPGKRIEPSNDMTGSFGPPYVLETVDCLKDQQPPKASKKRRRDAEPALVAQFESVKVSTYKPPNNGPYPVDIPKKNTVRFTPAQIEAIMSGSQPGLTVVIGPPGTGKTDVATQIINNIYHNWPEQRTLLIAHSNQALNQLFAKIVALDIDERHLLRLGHGEEDLDTPGNFSKHGRVESFLENRDRYLLEVTRLAASIGAPGAHGHSAETAGYFKDVYIQPMWYKFTELAKAEVASVADIVEAFPFHSYFSSAPQPLFPPDADRGSVLEIVDGCHRHISKIFSELADAQPFEILRRDRERMNYLLTNEARIVAMTSTHAAMRRGEIAQLGFHYDNVVMEEAAQITEIETFIPLAMQKPKDGRMRLQRVVVCGDHFQNCPVIQNLALRDFANLEQSLFSRLVRLGVQAIMLDQQGRARPSIAKLYGWRYPYLGNLPHVESAEEFVTTNAGFKYEYQFINVPDFKGKGESEPAPHFIQNLGEAEYAVGIYQYMRLLGYPASKVSILTTYAGQRALVRDVLDYRCARDPTFGLPKTVTTVDKYQGEQNDYIILSLTRTSKVGYLRDIRRLTVALSRAKLGLYIVGRREVFESCFELRQAFELLLQRPDELTLVTGERWPSQRKTPEDANETVAGEVVIKGVEHLGQYVIEMAATKVEQMQAEMGGSLVAAEAETPRVNNADVEEMREEEDVEEMREEDDIEEAEPEPELDIKE